MNVLDRQYLTIVFRWCQLRRWKYHQVVDHLGRQTVTFLHWWYGYTIIRFSHTSPIWRWWDRLRDAGMHAELDVYYAYLGKVTQADMDRARARARRHAMLTTALGTLLARGLCWCLGHQTESHADAENGTEDVYCTRCGWGFHAQF